MKENITQELYGLRTTDRGKCWGCGSPDHIMTSEKCTAKDAVCGFCGVKGHLEKCCKRKKQTGPNIRSLELQEEEENASEPLYYVKDVDSVDYKF